VSSVRVACLCGGRHPDGDEITLRDRLDFRSMMTVRNAVALALPAEAAEILAIITEQFVLLGVEKWTLVDENGKPTPVNRATINDRLLADVMAAAEVAEAVDELYGERYLLPLLNRVSNSSPHTPTAGSMSPTNGSAPKPPKPSKRSSTTTIPTAVTATTSPLRDGVSSSSQS
jgi:hypothetical protein